MTAASADPPLERTTRIVVSADAVSAELEDETVILGMRDGVYYGLDGVGSHVWRLAAAPVALGTVLAEIVRAYEVDEAVAWRDLQAVVRDLLAAGLLDRAPAR